METRDLIIETAFIAFIDYGYDRVSLNKIVKETGLTKGAFYHYFSSKDELIGEVMKTYFYGHLRKTIDIVDAEAGSFEERMDLVFKNVINTNVRLSSQPDRIVDWNDFLKLLWESLNLNNQMNALNKEYQASIVEVMERTIEMGKDENKIKDQVNSNEIAILLSAAVRGTILMSTQLSQAESEQMLRKNIGTIMKLIRK